MSGPIFPIIVAIIVVIAKVISIANKQAGNGLGTPVSPRRTGSPSPRRPENEEERRRRFMEAVGLPPETIPPPPVRPRTNPAPLLPVQPPGAYQAARRLARVPPAVPTETAPAPVRLYPIKRSVPPPEVPLVAPAVAQTVSAAAPVAVPRGAAVPAAQPSGPAKALFLRLRDTASIREAIVLREVLGPPKGLQG